MAKKALPTPDQLRQLLQYDPDTGHLRWLIRDASWFDGCPRCTAVWNTKWAGKPALASKNNQGYNRGSVLGADVLAHRVIIAMQTDEWPALKIDHIDGDGRNNRLANLRLATDRENSRNQKMNSNNTSGVCGVSWSRARSKWVVMISTDKQRCLGFFDKFEDAVAVRKAAEREHLYHSNHGRSPITTGG